MAISRYRFGKVAAARNSSSIGIRWRSAAGTWAKTATWISLALMGTATLLTFKFSGDVGRMDSRLDQYRRYPCDGDSGLCDENNNPAEPLSESDQQRSADIMRDASSSSLLGWVSLLGATSALVTTGVFAYLGYWAPARKTATVSGAIAPGSMGLAAHVTF